MEDEDPMAGKVSFDDIYDRPDPRAYFRTLAELDYQIPEHAREPFSLLARAVRRPGAGGPSYVLDLCCSYGINAMLLNCDVTLADLYARYRSPQMETLSSEELIAADREFFASRRNDDVPIVGVDAAENAIRYAVRAGLLHAGSPEDLEEAAPSADLLEHLTHLRLITVTGGIGYITGTTFDRLLGSVELRDPPWIATFTLRWVDMGPIASVLERFGYTLEVLPGRTFRQRRFATSDEREHALEELHRIGLDHEDVESDGYHHAVFHLARPEAEARARPIDELLEPVL